MDYRDAQQILGFLNRGEHKARFAQTKFKHHLLEYACVPLGHRGALQFKGEQNRKKKKKCHAEFIHGKGINNNNNNNAAAAAATATTTATTTTTITTTTTTTKIDTILPSNALSVG